MGKGEGEGPGTCWVAPATLGGTADLRASRTARTWEAGAASSLALEPAKLRSRARRRGWPAILGAQGIRTPAMAAMGVLTTRCIVTGGLLAII